MFNVPRHLLRANQHALDFRIASRCEVRTRIGVNGQTGLCKELQGGVLGLTTTAQQWRDKLLNIKAQAGRKCWLTVGDRTIQCVVRNVAIKPRTNPKLGFSVSFDFYQTGALEYTASL